MFINNNHAIIKLTAFVSIFFYISVKIDSHINTKSATLQLRFLYLYDCTNCL